MTVEHVLNFIGMALNLAGGLFLFLYGLKVMSTNIQKAASDGLKSIVNFLTVNKFLGVFFGAIITAVIQSSSATTVMLVGFANAGIIQLTQAMSIIFGANIGTTITAQIAAFKASALALPLIGIGGGMRLFSKKNNRKTYGEIILGLGMLFYGLYIMGSFLKPFRDNPYFLEAMTNMSSMPVLGIIVGVIITVILQSSSATTGMIIVLATQGMIDFKTAFILELGSNIGTTITAQLAAIGTNTTAKRVAWGHTLFNVIGSVYMTILLFIWQIDGQPAFLWFVNYITPGNGFAGENVARHAANAHTAFNVANAIILFPFISYLAKATERIIKETPDRYEQDIKFLDERMAKTPSVAIRQSVKETKRMMEVTKDLSRQCYQILFKNKDKALQTIHSRAEKLGRQEDYIVSFLIKFNSKLNHDDSERCNSLIHIVGHLKRIGKHQIAILEIFEMLNTIKETPDDVRNDLRKVYKINQELFFTLLKAFNGTAEYDPNALTQFKTTHETALELESTIRQEQVRLIRNKDIAPKAGFYLGEIMGHLDFTRDQLYKIHKALRTLQKK